MGSQNRGKSTVDDEFEEKEKKHPPTLFISEGKLHLRKNNYRKAIECFNEALAIKPNNVRVILLRSKCYSRLKEFDLAMEDAQTASRLDKKCIEAEHRKGQIQFCMGDLEFAYLTFQRGFRKRLYENLKYGMQNCEQAILNSIGPKSKFIITNAHIKQVEMRLQLKRIEFDKKKGMLEEKVLPQFDNRSLYLLLGYLYQDKILVDQLLTAQNTTLVVPDVYKESESEMKIKVEKAADFLNDCEEFWLMNKPLNCDQSHFIPFEASTQKSKEAIEDDSQHQVSIKKYIMIAYECKYSRNHKKCVEICKEILDMLKQTSDDDIQDTENKENIQITALKLMGQAYRHMKDYPSAIRCYKEYRDLALVHVMNNDILKAYLYIGECYLENQDYQRAEIYFKKALAKAASKSTAGYILLYISYCQCFMDTFKDARKYGACSLEIAQEINDKEMEIESLIFLGIVEYMDTVNIIQGKSCLYFQLALNLSRGTSDSERNVSLYQNWSLIHQQETNGSKKSNVYI